MTEEERPEAKEQEACFAAIREIVQEISRLMDAAYQQYSRLVEQVLNGSSRGIHLPEPAPSGRSYPFRSCGRDQRTFEPIWRTGAISPSVV